MKIKEFMPGIVFESDTQYIGENKEYHVQLHECVDAYVFGHFLEETTTKTAFLFKNLKNIVIDLQGAKLILHGRIAPFVLFNCENVTIKNFSVDYDRPFYTQGKIVAVDNSGLDIQIPECFPFRIADDGCFVATSNTWEQRVEGEHALFQPFDAQTLSPAFRAGAILGVFGKSTTVNPPFPVQKFKAQDLGKRKVKIVGDFPSTYQVGQVLVFLHEPRNKNTFFCYHSKNIAIHNVRILHCASMGFVGMFCENITIQAMNMYLDENSKGLVTANADNY